MTDEEDARVVELVENYRSKANLVVLDNDFLQTIAQRLKQTPIMAHEDTDGTIILVKHSGANMLAAAADVSELESLQGTTCIMTRTNDEALRLCTMLERNGLHVKLIQGGGEYQLQNLRELRFFTQALSQDENSLWADDETWREARRQLAIRFAGSSDLPMVEELLYAFERANPKRRYLSDFRLFVQESSADDYINTSRSGLYLSTMHKTKGREFDNVVIVSDGSFADNDEDKRLMYVAMTRAKNNLTIHFNKLRFFERYADPERPGRIGHGLIPNLEYREDSIDYPAADEIIIDLTHRDVVLSRFRNHQRAVEALQAGDTLLVREDFSGCNSSAAKDLLRFSREFTQRLEEYVGRGYRPCSCKANHVLYWHEKDHPDDEILILLPRLELHRVT
jgi:ATP-dependent DNA helicase RecQ